VNAYRAGVITSGEGVRRRAKRARERYERWEDRRRARLAGWSTRKRWVVLVLVPVLLCCCGGGAVGVPVAWFARVTVQAGQGAKAPEAAADEYLMTLGYGQEEGLLPVLDDDRQEQLLAQWRAYRADMQRTDPPPSRLDYGALSVGPVAGGRATVTVRVSATWWPAGGGFAGGYSSDEFEWRIETHREDGWRVSAVAAPAWCGGYVPAAKCTSR
jgi:hypothetical protein